MVLVKGMLIGRCVPCRLSRRRPGGGMVAVPAYPRGMPAAWQRPRSRMHMVAGRRRQARTDRHGSAARWRVCICTLSDEASRRMRRV